MDGLLSDITNLDPMTRWALVVAVGLTVFYAVMRPMRKKRDPLEKMSLRPGLASQRAVERDMNNLLVELSEMARQVTAQLDTRTLKLETLLKEADDKILQLKQAASETPVVPRSNGTEPVIEEKPSGPPSPAIDPRHLEVYELADRRLSSQQIACQLSRPRGEVDLILALRETSV
jgi:hypothetical protein